MGGRLFGSDTPSPGSASPQKRASASPPARSSGGAIDGMGIQVAPAVRTARTDGVWQQESKPESQSAFPGGRFALSIEAMLCPAFVCDGNGIVLEWNTALAEVSGWSEAQVRGKPLAEMLVTVEQQPALKKARAP